MVFSIVLPFCGDVKRKREIETGMIWLCVDILAFNGNIIKVLVSVIVVVLNYVGSKWLVFNKNHKH